MKTEERKPCEDRAEIGVLHVQDNERQGWPESTRS